MGNILNKKIKALKKSHKIKTKLLGLKGAKHYLVKRDGQTQPFITLAIFDLCDIGFDNYRTSETIEFAVFPTDKFTRGDVVRSMREVAEISTHIFTVLADGESVGYAIKKGDEFQPYYMDGTYKFFVHQISDRFVPSENV